MTCESCGRRDTEFCIICKDDDFYISEDDKAYCDWLYVLMCPEE